MSEDPSEPLSSDITRGGTTPTLGLKRPFKRRNTPLEARPLLDRFHVKSSRPRWMHPKSDTKCCRIFLFGCTRVAINSGLKEPKGHVKEKTREPVTRLFVNFVEFQVRSSSP
ncbi:hypothetical protein TNCV_3479921 [Trichonephila clavipes]|nr:hypothetical protein TNCV_3479921 [Trichonephila clavipes]